MDYAIHTCLQGILHHLTSVGDLLSALDRDEVNASVHWQAIREYRDNLRFLASQLPVVIRERLP